MTDVHYPIDYLWADAEVVKRVVARKETANGCRNRSESLTEDDFQQNVNDDAILEDPGDDPTFFTSNGSGVHLELSDNPSPAGSVSSRSFGSFLDKVKIFNRFRKLSEELEDSEDALDNFNPHVMSNDEIMHKYWKLGVRSAVFLAILA